MSGDATVAGNINVTGDLVYNEERGVNLLITGVSTITGSNTLGITSTKDLNVVGVSTLTNAGITNLVGTSATVTNLNATHSNVTGVTTVATGFSTNLTATQLTVTGVSTISDVEFTSSVGGGATVGSYTGITTYIGDGSLLTGIAAGGSGQFNTGISGATAYAITDSMATAYTASASSDYRTIVHSIHVTNITGSEVTVSGEIQASFSFAHTIPVPAGSSVELLKQPKVLGPSETIELQASATSSLQATIIVEAKEDTDLWDAQVDLTASATMTDVYTSTSNPSVVQSILLANDDGTNDVKARIAWTDGSNTVQAYYCYDMIIPADSTVELCEQPKYLPSGYKIRAYANQADRLEVTASGKQITS